MIAFLACVAVLALAFCGRPFEAIVVGLVLLLLIFAHANAGRLIDLTT